jgi:hypothetical protein
MFNNCKFLDTVSFGQVIEKSNSADISYIYINGIRVAEEPKYAFHYNITSVPPKMRKALNRERNNLGRSVYSDRIKDILLKSNNDIILKKIADELKDSEKGNQHDDLIYLDVRRRAAEILSKKDNVVLVTKEELVNNMSTVDEMKREGKEIVVVDDKLHESVKENKEVSTMSKFVETQNSNIEFKFVTPADFTEPEKIVFNKTADILKLINVTKIDYKISISETMKKDTKGGDMLGLWVSGENHIIIKRSQLSKFEDYAGTLIHEFTHALTGTDDVTREFEIALTNNIGKIVKNMITN